MIEYTNFLIWGSMDSTINFLNFDEVRFRLL